MSLAITREMGGPGISWTSPGYITTRGRVSIHFHVPNVSRVTAMWNVPARYVERRIPPECSDSGCEPNPRRCVALCGLIRL